jgi:hypothetical protein
LVGFGKGLVMWMEVLRIGRIGEGCLLNYQLKPD